MKKSEQLIQRIKGFPRDLGIVLENLNLHIWHILLGPTIVTVTVFLLIANRALPPRLIAVYFLAWHLGRYYGINARFYLRSGNKQKYEQNKIKSLGYIEVLKQVVKWE